MVVPVAREVGALSLRKQTSNGNYASLTATYASSPFSDSTLVLLGGDGPDQDPKDRFGDDIRNRIADLLAG